MNQLHSPRVTPIHVCLRLSSVLSPLDGRRDRLTELWTRSVVRVLTFRVPGPGHSTAKMSPLFCQRVRSHAVYSVVMKDRLPMNASSGVRRTELPAPSPSKRNQGIDMAKGRKCRECGNYMFAEREDNQPKGRRVVYVCQNRQAKCNGREKVFEEYSDKRR